MKNYLLIFLMVPFIWACSTVQEGSDPVVVRAEQAAEIATLTFDSLFKIEYDNRVWIDENQPDIRDSVNKLRSYAPTAIKSLRATTGEYRLSRSDESKSNLIRIIESTLAGVSKANELISTIEQKNAP